MKAYSFLTKCLHMLCVFVVSYIFILNFAYTVTVSYDAAEKVTIESDVVKSLLFLLIAGAALLAISFLKKHVEKVKEKTLFIVLSAVYLFMAIYLILNVDHTLRADVLSVSRAAKELLAGSEAALGKGGYIYQYPHQIGLMLYDALLYLYTENTAINFIANFAFVLGINFMIYKITDEIFANRLTNILAIFMAFAFLPQFFFILFAYGTIPGLFFMLLAFYHTLRFGKTNRLVNLLLTVVGGCTAVILRKNLLIGVLAIVLFLCLELLKKFSYKPLILVGCLLVSLLIPLKILPSIFVGGGNGAPSILWIAMGTDIDNEVRGPGWYDGSNEYIFRSSGNDAELAREKGREKLGTNIEKMTDEPVKACLFFFRKAISQWCDPLYQSLWSGPLENCGQHTDTPLLKSLYNGTAAEDILAGGMKLYMLSFFGMCLIFMVKYHEEYHGWQLLFLMLIGGFLFYAFWEGKSQYTYPHFFALIPFSAFSMSRLLTKCEPLTLCLSSRIRDAYDRIARGKTVNKRLTVKTEDGRVCSCVLSAQQDFEQQLSVVLGIKQGYGRAVRVDEDRIRIVDYYCNETIGSLCLLSTEDTRSPVSLEWTEIPDERT